jgi:hypothetical protein
MCVDGDVLRGGETIVGVEVIEFETKVGDEVVREKSLFCGPCVP